MFHGDMRFDKSRYLREGGRRQNGQCPYWEGHCKAKGRLFGRLLFDSGIPAPVRLMRCIGDCISARKRRRMQQAVNLREQIAA